MRRPVYKALDKPNSLFGLKGIYIRYAAVGAVVSVFVGIIIGRMTVELFGMFAFMAALAVVYISILAFQAKFPEREKDRLLCSLEMPSFITVPPKRLSKYINITIDAD